MKLRSQNQKSINKADPPINSELPTTSSSRIIENDSNRLLQVRKTSLKRQKPAPVDNDNNGNKRLKENRVKKPKPSQSLMAENSGFLDPGASDMLLVIKDEMMAKLLQEQFDREYNRDFSSSSSLDSDEKMARLLQEQFDKENNPVAQLSNDYPVCGSSYNCETAENRNIENKTKNFMEKKLFESRDRKKSNQFENQNKNQDNQTAIVNCSICVENKINTALSCGHLLCDICAGKLLVCHICRKLIATKIKIFL